MTSSFESALGTIYITTSDEAVRAISFNPKQSFDSPLTQVHRAFRRQIKEYFEGKRKVFDLGLDLEGTPFQKEVWKITSRIPFGETRTYRDIAKQLGDVKKSRAVGHALGLKPHSDCCSLPSSYWRRRQTSWICRRQAKKAMVAQPRI